MLYGRVAPEDSAAGAAPLFVYVTDSTGFLVAVPPARPFATTMRALVQTSDGPLQVPARAELFDARDGDTLRLQLTIDDAVASDTRLALAERGEGGAEAVRALRRPWFVQMAGEAVISGRVRGVPLAGRGRGFFETYR